MDQDELEELIDEKELDVDEADEEDLADAICEELGLEKPRKRVKEKDKSVTNSRRLSSMRNRRK